MPTTCGFPNCKFRSRYRGCEDNRHFYRVPKKPSVLRKRWLEAIGRTEETIVSQLRVCSGHFYGGEKREGDIPVADPEIDPLCRIELPPKANRSSGLNKGSLHKRLHKSLQSSQQEDSKYIHMMEGNASRYYSSIIEQLHKRPTNVESMDTTINQNLNFFNQNDIMKSMLNSRGGLVQNPTLSQPPIRPLDANLSRQCLVWSNFLQSMLQKKTNNIDNSLLNQSHVTKPEPSERESKIQILLLGRHVRHLRLTSEVIKSNCSIIVHETVSSLIKETNYQMKINLLVIWLATKDEMNEFENLIQNDYHGFSKSLKIILISHQKSLQFTGKTCYGGVQRYFDNVYDLEIIESSIVNQVLSMKYHESKHHQQQVTIGNEKNKILLIGDANMISGLNPRLRSLNYVVYEERQIEEMISVDYFIFCNVERKQHIRNEIYQLISNATNPVCIIYSNDLTGNNSLMKIMSNLSIIQQESKENLKIFLGIPEDKIFNESIQNLMDSFMEKVYVFTVPRKITLDSLVAMQTEIEEEISLFVSNHLNDSEMKSLKENCPKSGETSEKPESNMSLEGHLFQGLNSLPIPPSAFSVDSICDDGIAHNNNIEMHKSLFPSLAASSPADTKQPIHTSIIDQLFSKIINEKNHLAQLSNHVYPVSSMDEMKKMDISKNFSEIFNSNNRNTFFNQFCK